MTRPTKKGQPCKYRAVRSKGFVKLHAYLEVGFVANFNWQWETRGLLIFFQQNRHVAIGYNDFGVG